MATTRIRPRKGDRYRALGEVPVRGLVRSSATLTREFPGRLPAGSVLTVEHHPPAGAGGVHLRPDNYESLEMVLVPMAERLKPTYDSYTVAVTFENLEAHFERLEE
ncbi:MAG: hypothetical protein H6907_06895 [Hyphomicrobiales bacterium]|nr:hypothetical protein [Hyphomicrobiales bacterium]